MDRHVLLMHSGDKGLITGQIAAHNEKTILFFKSQRSADCLADNLAKDAFLLAPCTVESHKQFVLEHSNYLKNKKMQPRSQPTLPALIVQDEQYKLL